MANVMTKIMQDAYYIERILHSCNTIEQLISCSVWIRNMFVKWDNLFESDKSIRYKFTRHRKDADIKFVIETIVPHLSETCNEIKAKIEEANKKRDIVVKGF